MASGDESSVRVALRIRPPIARELIDGCRLCTSVTPNQPQVWIGSNNAFTYDYVFDVDSQQEAVFETVRGLIDGCLDGYNATILAYGQTGSGKTYTMGTGFDVETHHSIQISESQGIIPRAVHYLFNSIQSRREEALGNSQTPPDFTVTAQFVELYNEEVIDLIDPDISAKSGRKGPGTIQIREDPSGGIYLVGVGSKTVSTTEDAMNCLHKGALSRTTATTNMNDQSSRSHAIFTLHIKQQRVLHSNEDAMDTGAGISELETLSAKFHFVDLAGSERLKRTGAVGDRAKEGISINGGLLSLGNVISALGDRSKKASHIPYRDSKLTRLLQDSLGGNSRTIVIACVSPCDRDFLETLNTLKYANRARNIKNRVTINQDKSSSTIAHLRAQIQQLELELQEYKQGKRAITDGGDEIETDTYHENILLHTELTTLKGRIKALQGTIEKLTARNAQLLAERATGTWNMSDNKADLGNPCDLTVMVQNYLQEIEELRAKLCESEAICEHLRKKIVTDNTINMNASHSPRTMMTSMTTSGVYNNYLEPTVEPLSVDTLLQDARQEVEQEQRIAAKLLRREKYQSRQNQDEPGNENENDDLEEMESSGGDEGDTDGASDEDDESEGATGDFGIQLAQLSNEIGTKQRLIDALELSQKRMEAMKAQYEEKLLCLASRIKATQEERDKVLSSMQQQRITPQGKINQVKEDYEKKLVGMQTELKKWQSAHKEHQKKVRNQSQYERQMLALRQEIDGMKRNKVKLMNQLKEENVKRRDMEARRNKEITQLKKSGRIKDIAMRNLETEVRVKDQVLKRKHEEVNALKKMSRLATATRKELKYSASTLKRYSPVKAKSKWTQLQSTLMKTVSIKQTIDNLEKEMISHIDERQKAQADIDMLKEERSHKMRLMSSAHEINHLSDQIDTASSTIVFLEDKIKEIQQNMVELEATSTREEEESSIATIISGISKDEVGYVMDKMYQKIVDQMISNSNSAKQIQSLEHFNNQLSNEVRVLREMMQYNNGDGVLLDDLTPAYAQQLESICSDFAKSAIPVRESNSSISAIPDRRLMEFEQGDSKRSNGLPSSLFPAPRRNLLANGDYDNKDDMAVDELQEGGVGRKKGRRLTGMPKDFEGSSFVLACNDDAEFVNPNDVAGFSRGSSFRGRVERRGTYTLSDAGVFSGSEMPSSLPSLPTLPANPGVSRVNSLSRKMLPRDRNKAHVGGGDYGFQSYLSSTSSAQPNRNLNSTHGSSLAAHKQQLRQEVTSLLTPNADTTFLTEPSPEPSPPTSPGVMRRSGFGAENVFQRLTSSMANPESSLPTGLIRPVHEKGSHHKNPLIQTHVADGHSKPILSIYATRDKIFTASKDATVKIWDLSTGQEIETLTGYPTNVNCVRYWEEYHLVLSASCYFVKIWDDRVNPSKSVITLQSSGASSDNSLRFDQNSRTHHLPPGEYNINDIKMSRRSNAIYTPFNDKVRVWDVRSFASVGLLAGKHGSQVMCLASEDASNKEVLISGSKDHFLKVYEFQSTSSVVNTCVPPRVTLDPPHYDGIESLALSGSTLFSGSRDMCIRKWDLTKFESVNFIKSAHTGWVTGLSYAPNNDGLLLSCSKDGYMKLWSAESCKLLANVEAAKGGVHCLARNSSMIFTGADNGTVGFWRLRTKKQVEVEEEDASPEESSDNSL